MKLNRDNKKSDYPQLPTMEVTLNNKIVIPVIMHQEGTDVNVR